MRHGLAIPPQPAKLIKSMNFGARTLLSFASFYLGWWACALGPTYGFPLAGPLLMPLWIGLHLYYSPTALGEALFFVALATLGFVFDTVVISSGILSLVPPSPYPPPWLVSMWVLLGITFESMLLVRRSRWLVSLTGLLSGPLTYFFAEALNLIVYTRPIWLSMLVHGLIWALLMPFLFTLRDFCIRLGLRLDRDR